MEFAKELWVSLAKLDDLMRDLSLEYDTTPRDKRVQVVSEENQEAIKEYLDTGKVPKK